MLWAGSVLKRILETVTVHNLTVYLVLATALVSGLAMILGTGPLEGAGVRVLLYPLQLARPGGGFGEILWLGLLLLAMYSFGTGLEADMGKVLYNGYIYLGYALIVVGGAFFPGLVPAWYLSMSLLLGTAYYGGDREILLFFVIPVKIKWFAYAFAAIAILEAGASALSGAWWNALAPIVGMGNFIVVCGGMWFRERVQGRAVHARMERLQPTDVTIHRCVTCGKTERDDPQAEFRFCVHCRDHEYCMDHLHNHPHQT